MGGDLMRTGIEQARIELAKWESRVTEDEAALASIEKDAQAIRAQLAVSVRSANSLRHAVQQWDAMYATQSAER